VLDDRPHPFVTNLSSFKFQYIGALWESSFHLRSAIYALVATKVVKIYPYVLHEDTHVADKTLGPSVTVEPEEVFYIGLAERLSRRLGGHKRGARQKAFTGPQKGQWVSLILYEATQQDASVDVYCCEVPDELVFVGGLPIDLLRGCEAGLIRLLNPIGNRRLR
jgi:hypothetical protein